MKIITIMDSDGHVGALEYNVPNMQAVIKALSAAGMLEAEPPVLATAEEYEEFIWDNGPVGRSGGNVLDFVEVVPTVGTDFHPWD